MILRKDIFLFYIRYVDRLVDSLKSKLEAAEKMAESQKVVKMKYEEALEEQRKLEPKINLIVEKTKILLSQVKDAFEYLCILHIETRK